MDVQKLIDIARECGQNDLAERLLDLGSENGNANLRLPLVGEFSSGKTTLINAISDGKGLETASAPTTSVIYQVFFGQEKNEAIIIDKDGNEKEINDIESLKNEELEDNAEVVNIFDTCKKIPASTVLIDTPGLGSMNTSHKKALDDFLPEADAILFTLDVSRGSLTKKLEEFIQIQQAIIKKPLYLIITMSDKVSSEDDVKKVIEYIKKNDSFGFKKIISVSAKNNQLDAFYDLIAEIDRDKSNILKTVNEQRIKNIAKMLSKSIDELLIATNDDDTLNKSIAEAKRDLDKLMRNIETLIDDTKNDIDDIRQLVTDEFCSTADRSLMQFANIQNEDLNNMFNDVVQSLSVQSFNKYKSLVQIKLNEKARERMGTDNEVNLPEINEEDIDNIGEIVLDGNLDLSSVGHKYDKGISTALNIIGTGLTIAGIALSPLTLGISGGATIVTRAGVDAIGYGTLAAAKAAKAAKAARAAKEMKALQTIKNIKTGINVAGTVVESAEKGQKVYEEKYKGFTEKLVSGFAEMLAPGQRKIVIRNFVETELKPSFDCQLENVTQNLFVLIEKSLQNAAKTKIDLKQENLQTLRKQREEHNEEYRKTIDKYRQYKVELANFR